MHGHGTRYMVVNRCATMTSHCQHCQSCSCAVDHYGSRAKSFTNRVAFYRLLLPQLTVLEATVRADLINACLPDRVQSLALQKAAVTVADSLYLTLQTHLPSEPSARVGGLADIEALVRPARGVAEALAFLRSWWQKIMTVVNDLGGNPEPLKLLGSLMSKFSHRRQS